MRTRLAAVVGAGALAVTGACATAGSADAACKDPSKSACATQLLSGDAFEAKNPNLFTPALDLDPNTPGYEAGTFPNASPMAPAGANNGNKPAVIQRQLKKMLTKRVGKQATAQALKTYNGDALKQVAPEAKVRAALVALTGTIAEPALESVLAGDLHSVRFETFPEQRANVVALLVQEPGEDKPSVLLNERFENADFRQLAPIVGHEVAFHNVDLGNSSKEEMIANAAQAINYAEFLAEKPGLAKVDEQVTRVNNTILLARINTRDDQGNVRLSESEGSVFVPNGRVVDSFADNFKPQGTTGTPSNDVANKVIANMTGDTTDFASFDGPMVDAVDQGQKALTPDELIKVAKALQLDVGKC